MYYYKINFKYWMTVKRYKLVKRGVGAKSDVRAEYRSEVRVELYIGLGMGCLRCVAPSLNRCLSLISEQSRDVNRVGVVE